MEIEIEIKFEYLFPAPNKVVPRYFSTKNQGMLFNHWTTKSELHQNSTRANLYTLSRCETTVIGYFLVLFWFGGFLPLGGVSNCIKKQQLLQQHIQTILKTKNHGASFSSISYVIVCILYVGLFKKRHNASVGYFIKYGQWL